MNQENNQYKKLKIESNKPDYQNAKENLKNIFPKYKDSFKKNEISPAQKKEMNLFLDNKNENVYKQNSLLNSTRQNLIMNSLFSKPNYKFDESKNKSIIKKREQELKELSNFERLKRFKNYKEKVEVKQKKFTSKEKNDSIDGKVMKWGMGITFSSLMGFSLF